MKDYTEIDTLLKNYFFAFKELKKAGITPNKKDFTSQVGEWLVAEIYGGIKAKSAIQKDWDLELNGKRIQVKAHSKAITNNNKKTPIRYNEYAEIDELIIIIFSEEYTIKEFYSIPWKQALQLIKRNKTCDEIYWNSLNNFKMDLNKLPNQPVLNLFKSS